MKRATLAALFPVPMLAHAAEPCCDSASGADPKSCLDQFFKVGAAPNGGGNGSGGGTAGGTF